MEQVLKQAEVLAEAILASKEYIQMRLLEQAAMKDDEAGKLVAEYSEKRAQVEKTLAQSDMDHGALASAGAELEAAEKAIDEYTLLREMRDARNAFSDMMGKVNNIIKYVVTGESPEDTEGGCSGSCGSCGGCGGQ